MSASLTRCLLLAILACLVGCQQSQSTLTDTTPRGGGSETTLTGLVLDQSGRPFAGAAIRLHGEDDMPEDLAASVVSAPSAPQAFSGPDGRYRLTGVRAQMAYLIECRGTERMAAVVRADARDGDSVVAPDAILRPTGSVRGQIVFPDSLQPAFAVYAYLLGLVNFTVARLPMDTVAHPLSDRYLFEIKDVPAGTYTLRLSSAYAGELATWSIREVPAVTILSGQPTDLGDLAMPRRAAVENDSVYLHDFAVVKSFFPLPDGINPGDSTGDYKGWVSSHTAVLGNRIVALHYVDQSPVAIGDRVRELDALESLYIYNFPNADSAGQTYFPSVRLSPMLSELPRLRRIRLRNVSGKDLPNWTGSFPGLSSLTLENAVTGKIPPWVLACRGLRYLDLGGDSLVTVPDGIAGISGLQVLNLGGNPIQAFPKVLKSMPNLHGVGLRYDRICAPTAEEKAWIVHQDSLWVAQEDPLEGNFSDTLSWEATQFCGSR